MFTSDRGFLRGAPFVLATILGLSGAGTQATAQTIRLPETRTIDLPNGLRVVLAEQRTLPLIEVHLRTPAGSAAEPPAREGLATFTAELLTQGTATRSATQIAEAVDRMGATLGAGAARDDLHLSLSVMSRHRAEALALLADCVINPSFPAAEVERIRTRLLAGVKQMTEDPEALADLALWRAEFGADAYGRRLLGGEASLAAITAEELRRFHQGHVVPRGSALALVGDFDMATMEKEITELFGGWRGGSTDPAGAEPVRPPMPAPATEVLLVAKPELEQSQIRIGYRGLERGHPDEPALIAAATILGGGFTSRLLQAVRVERSLSYDASCRLIQEGRAGLVRVSTFTKTATTRETVDVALEEIRKLRTEAPTQEELARTQSYLSGAVARSLQAPADIAQNLALVAFYGLPADYVPRRVERIRAVQVADVRRMMETHFAPERMVLVVVADPAAVKGQLAGLGPLEEVGFTTLIE